MNKDDYIHLFEWLGFWCQDGHGNRLPVADAYNRGRTLRHDDGRVPTIYFNGNDSGVYFVVRLEDSRHFIADLWHEIESRRPSEDDRRYVTLIPNPRAVRRAVHSLRPVPNP